MAQIIGYVTAAESEQFHARAAAAGIDASALGNLLIARELAVGRLGAIRLQFGPEPPTHDRVKITAHQRDETVKQSFTAHAAAFGMKRSPAAAVLFRAELWEHWLERCLRINQFDSD